MFDLNKTSLDEALSLLAKQLHRMGSPKFGLVVCGGASLLATGLVSRTTRDVDVLALVDSDQELADPDPLPPYLVEAASHVERILGLPPEWLNNRPSRGDGGLYRMGLPQGLKDRLHRRSYGETLTVYFIDRIDQIHLKLYAAVDRGGYHIADLMALTPSESELELSACWTMTHDVSPEFRKILQMLLTELGYESLTTRI